MPPYRANPGGAFNSGLFPAPVARVDVGDAIRALGQSASSLLEATYIRKIADQNRQAREAQAKADRARQADRDRMADEMARENLRLRQETLRLQRERDERAAQPKAPEPQWSESRGGWIVPPSADAPAGRFIAPDGIPAAAIPPAQRRQEEERAAREAEEDAASAVWLERNRRNPEVVAALGVLFRTNPALAQTPNRAASILRRTLGELGAPGGTGAKPPPRPNGEQTKDYLFFNYMQGAVPDLDRMEGTVRGDRLSAALRLPEEAGMRVLNPQEQVFYRAARAFVAGTLRKETGAAFSENEVRDTFARFIPLSGDSPELIRAKRAARQEQLRIMGELALPARQYYDAMQRGQPTGGTDPADLDAAINAVLGRNP